MACGTRVPFLEMAFQRTELPPLLPREGAVFSDQRRQARRWEAATSQCGLRWAAKSPPPPCGVSGDARAAELSNPRSAQKGWYPPGALQPFGVLSSGHGALGSAPAPPSSAPGPALPAPRRPPDAGRPGFARCRGRTIRALPGGGSLQQSRSRQRRRRKASPAPSLPDLWADAVSFPTSASSPTAR